MAFTQQEATSRTRRDSKESLNGSNQNDVAAWQINNIHLLLQLEVISAPTLSSLGSPTDVLEKIVNNLIFVPTSVTKKKDLELSTNNYFFTNMSDTADAAIDIVLSLPAISSPKKPSISDKDEKLSLFSINTEVWCINFCCVL